jgi:predicted ferric reductase
VTTWIVLRAAGIGAYVMLFLSVVWGLASTTSVLGKRVSKASATTIHQFTATCGLFLLGVHLGGLLVDTFTPFSVADVTIPMSSSFRPVAVTFGIVAMYLMVFVIVASWLRKPIGTTWWRRTHMLAVPTFVLSMVHGVFAGTDSARPAMWWTYVGTGLLVVFLLVVRGLTAGFRPERAAHPNARPRATAPAARPAPVARPAAGVPVLPAPPPTGEREQPTLEPAVA